MINQKFRYQPNQTYQQKVNFQDGNDKSIQRVIQ